MYGQMTAGSWIYIGTQGILQGTYETFAAAARKHFGGDLAGKLVVSGGMGGMGGAQPLAATLNGAAFLGIDVDPERIKRRVKTGYCDVMVNDLDEALRILKNAVRKREATSVGLVGNCADVIPELARRGVVPDLLTDQTSAHDPVGGYIPKGMSVEQAAELRAKRSAEYRKRSLNRSPSTWKACSTLQKLGAVTFDYGNNIRTFAFEQGVKRRLRFPGLRACLHPPAVLRRARAVPLGCAVGRTFRHRATDQLVLEMFPHGRNPEPLDQARAEARALSGIARAHLLARLWRARQIRPGAQRSGRARRIESSHRHRPRSPRLRFGGFSLPRNGEDARWLGRRGGLAACSTPCSIPPAAPSWVSIHNGGGVGIGYSLHAGQVIVADGTQEMAARIERVLTNDPGIGVARHVDAGYSEAISFAKKTNLKVPMQ